VGLGNYVYLFTRDPLFWRSLGVTFTYTLVAVPLNLALALVLAMLLNLRVPGMRVLRTVYYLPTVMPQVATSMLWMFLFAPTFGVIDWALAVLFHITGPNWLSDPHWVMPAFILMSLWGVGGAMVIFLAGLQSVPPELYEAAQLDGASGIVQFVRVTLPSISPVVLFNLIVGMIGAMQIFTTAFVMTQGGPDYASYFFNLAIYNNAFVYFKMGLASAQAWVLLLIVMIMTLVVFATSSRWVFYGSGR
jgi:multiple sugar transport system permease protein